MTQISLSVANLTSHSGRGEPGISIMTLLPSDVNNDVVKNEVAVAISKLGVWGFWGLCGLEDMVQ